MSNEDDLTDRPDSTRVCEKSGRRNKARAGNKDGVQSGASPDCPDLPSVSEKSGLKPDQWNAIIYGSSHDPHQVLGLHTEEESKIILWRPGASEVYLEFNGKIDKAQCIDEAGFFSYQVPKNTSPHSYRIFHHNGLLTYDPYSFLPSIHADDLWLFSKGVHYRLYRILGANRIIHDGIEGVRFAVWAPNAVRVSLVGDLNYWDGRVNPMRSMGASGVWELFIPGLPDGEKYKYEIKTQSGEILNKADPYAFHSELRPATASIVAQIDQYLWNDEKWLTARPQQSLDRPFLVYEVHLGSWKRDQDLFPKYRNLAHQLSDYCQEMGFTHIELMPVGEHPFDDSWGYQITGNYSPTSRYGSLQDFQYFIDVLHQRGIGVILDWVPAHFPQDSFSLGKFDGTALYEHANPSQGIHPHWSTYIYNYSRPEVLNFLIANACFWIEEMHIDALRVDAVASMLYLDYGRSHGQWVPNIYGGNLNLEAIEFLKHLNSIVHQRYPGVLMIAEESTAFPNLTKSVQDNGMGFDLKWNMGWMNDTLRYFSVDPIFRCYHHNDLTFSLLYAFSERFILPFSHDEVVHCKRSLLSKMPGDLWQEYANMRLLYSYMICHPGKKLLFMGGEIGQREEWNCHQDIEWWGLQYQSNQKLQAFVKDLNHFYHAHPSLWEIDFNYTGFEWVDHSDSTNSVTSYLRKGKHETLLCVHNYTPVYHERYHIKLAHVTQISEVFNSDELRYGGSGKQSLPIRIHSHSVEISIAPLSTMIFSFFL